MVPRVTDGMIIGMRAAAILVPLWSCVCLLGWVVAYVASVRPDEQRYHEAGGPAPTYQILACPLPAWCATVFAPLHELDRRWRPARWRDQYIGSRIRPDLLPSIEVVIYPEDWAFVESLQAKPSLADDVGDARSDP